MMLSPWVVYARIIIFLEGIGGIVLNCYLTRALLRTNLGSAAKLYRISCIVSAISNVYTSILIAIDINIPLMVGGGFLGVLYGPLILMIPKRLADFSYVAFASQTHMMWQLIPSPSILQYLSLKKSESRNSTKLFYAYVLPIVFQINSWIHCLHYVPSEEFRDKFQKVLAELHGSTPDDCIIYGIPVNTTNGEYNLMTQFYFDVFPSYLACYGVFAFSALQIRAKLRSLGNIASSKTEQMQRRFFLMQIAQVFLPMVIISIPTGIMAVAAFIGADMDNFSFLFVYAFWISPTAQALLLLVFMKKSAKRISEQTTKNYGDQDLAAPHIMKENTGYTSSLVYCGK